MNHLLIYNEFNEHDVFITDDKNTKSKKQKRKKKNFFSNLNINITKKKSKLSNKSTSNTIPKRYLTTLIISSTIAFIFTFSLISSNFIKNENNKISDKLNSIYNTTSLYSANLTSSIDSSYPYIIGKLEIEKINLKYTILSSSTDDYLDMSICRFAGPLPNEIGNLCIAGHNYINSDFFGRLKELNIGDNLKVYDLQNNFLEYTISNIYETAATDLSCTSQDTNGNKQVTLVTCNNITNKRLIIVANKI